ncbi:MAG: hypothetical protein ACI89L_002737 [Phycisphaerales bacterium]|jgi:hypothetical protein
MGRPKAIQIDGLMEQASISLAETRYFDAADHAAEAMKLARRAADFERMARICMPLQEARRQVRLQAEDAGVVCVAKSEGELPGEVLSGCYLFQPPLLGIDGRRLREIAHDEGVPVFVITREPMTRDGRWPIVAVGQVVVRAKVAPPEGVQRVETGMRKDNFEGTTVPLEWIQMCGEALGDAAIADAEEVAGDDPAAFLVDDLVERLDAVVDHERLHQRLEAACRQAMTEPMPSRPRRRAVVSIPFGL